jgi:hypothetical protein
MSALEIVALIVCDTIVAAVAYRTGHQVGYMRGRRDERL